MQLNFFSLYYSIPIFLVLVHKHTYTHTHSHIIYTNSMHLRGSFASCARRRWSRLRFFSPLPWAQRPVRSVPPSSTGITLDAIIVLLEMVNIMWINILLQKSHFKNLTFTFDPEAPKMFKFTKKKTL